MASPQGKQPTLPRVAITFCTQCRWMLRAAYFGQELLSTFSTTIGEIALIPATGGIFTVELTYRPSKHGNETNREDDSEAMIEQVIIWDRKTEGGFPETKVLKQLIRDRLQPNRDLGHSDRHGKKTAVKDDQAETQFKADLEEQKGVTREQDKKTNDEGAGKAECEDCQ